jgi:uncharacterized protein YjdB
MPTVMKHIFTSLLVLFLSTTVFGQLIINEVLYDPSNNALDGDANGDGVYDQEDDSFIEFYNTSITNLDVSGYQIWDDTNSGSLVYTIAPSTIIPPMGVLVVFGGGIPTGYFGGALIQTADTSASGLNLNNSGERIIIKNAIGTTVLSFNSDSLSNNPNESYTRYPDITGDFIQHNDSTPLLFSPGLRTNGLPFDTNLVVESISVQGQGGVSTITTNQGTLQMEATVLPANAANTSVTWSVVNGTGAASISTTGVLTAGADGVITVIATANDGTGITGQTNITLSNQVGILVNSITVQGQGGTTSITTQGGSLQMEATVLPANADDNTVTWSVSPGTGSGSISASGLLTAITNGTVTVTATANDASGVTGSAEINISNQGPILVDSIFVEGQGGINQIDVVEGTLQMEANVFPTNADDQTITWSITAGEELAEISSSGMLSALDNGTVTVTATANDGSGVTGSAEITISNQPNAVAEIDNKLNVTLYPNPTKGLVKINTDEIISSIEVYDIIGRKQLSKTTLQSNMLDLSGLAEGQYILKITSDEATQTAIIVKR